MNTELREMNFGLREMNFGLREMNFGLREINLTCEVLDSQGHRIKKKKKKRNDDIKPPFKTKRYVHYTMIIITCIRKYMPLPKS